MIGLWSAVGIVIASRNAVPDLRASEGAERTVGTSYYWVLMGSRGYSNFDLGIRFGKCREFMSQE